MGVERPDREADHSPPSSEEVKQCVELYFHSPNTSLRGGAQLKHRNKFTFMHLYYGLCVRETLGVSSTNIRYCTFILFEILNKY